MPTKKQAPSAPTKKASAPQGRSGQGKKGARGVQASQSIVVDAAPMPLKAASKPSAKHTLGAAPTPAQANPSAPTPVAEKPSPVATAPVAATSPQAEAKATPPAAPTGPRSLPTIAAYQRALAQAGVYPGLWDGAYGSLTRQATARFQAQRGLPVTGDPSPATLVALGF